MSFEQQKIIVFLGPPGIGKGTQAKILAADHDMIHLSTGDIIRDEVGRKSDIGKLMEEMGWRSPEKLDVLVLEALEKRLNDLENKPVILDGCPRSLGQAKALDELLIKRHSKIDQVIEFYGDDDVLMDRMIGRFACAVQSCKQIYHDTAKPTLVQNVCDICGGGDFYRRPEDSRETILFRFKTYREMTLPVVADYTQRGMVNRVDGTGTVEATTAALLNLF